jgi:hypothetical protein
MPIEVLHLTQYDLQPVYSVTVVDSSGSVIDITGATIRTTMRLENSTTLAINRSTAGITLTDATAGQFEYQWQAGETDTPGSYDIEFEITPSAGGKFTLPNPTLSQSTSKGPAHVKITRGLDST